MVKIADAWDAMTSDRPYRQGMSRNQALATLRKVAGTQMDPAITEVFCKLWGSERLEGERESDLVRLSEGVGDSARVGLPQPVERKDA